MKQDYIRFPKCPEDVYKWVAEGYTGMISYSKLSGYVRGNYPSLMRIKDKQGRWVNIIPPQPNKEWLAKADSEVNWDSVIAGLEVDSDDWQATGWRVEHIRGWINFYEPDLDVKHPIKLPGHPQFKWWFKQLVARHPDLIEAVAELPEDYQLPYTPEPLPDGPEDIAPESSGGGNSEVLKKLAVIEKKLDSLLNIFS